MVYVYHSFLIHSSSASSFMKCMSPRVPSSGPSQEKARSVAQERCRGRATGWVCWCVQRWEVSASLPWAPWACLPQPPGGPEHRPLEGSKRSVGTKYPKGKIDGHVAPLLVFRAIKSWASKTKSRKWGRLACKRLWPASSLSPSWPTCYPRKRTSSCFSDAGS